MKSQNAARPKPMMSERLAASVVLIVFGLLSEMVVLSAHSQGRAVANAVAGTQNPERTNTGNGIIVGGVVNDRREPVTLARVHAFSLRTATQQEQEHKTVPFSARASGLTSTDTEGRFQISGLELGEYLVAAEPFTSRTAYESTETPLYATTFYPSTIHYQLAAAVSVIASGTAPIQIELVRVKGTSNNILIPARWQVSMFLNQIPGLPPIPSPFQGVLRVWSDRNRFFPPAISVAALRGRYNERGEFLITTTSAIAEVFATTSSELLFPHFAIGGGYQTQLVLFSDIGASGTVYLFDQNGNPVSLPVQ